MRRARRTDANQKDIVAALRAAGRTVEVISDVGRGVPDLLVSFRGVNYLLEVKIPGAKLTPDEAMFHAGWDGPIAVVTTEQEAVNATAWHLVTRVAVNR